MQRWQRRVHLWLWLAIGAVVGTVFVKLTEPEPHMTMIEIPEQP